MTISYRTDLAAYVFDLLTFVEEKIAEAQRDPASRKGALTEAAGAIPVIRDRLRQDHEPALAQFMLLGIMDADLGAMAGLPDDAFPAAITDFHGRIGIAKGIIASLEAR